MSEDSIVIENKQPQELLAAMKQIADSVTKKTDQSSGIWLHIFCSVSEEYAPNSREAALYADAGLTEYNKRFGEQS